MKLRANNKFVIIFGLAVVITAACALSFWQNAKTAKLDAAFRQNLAGTWWSNLDNMHLTNMVAPNGMFTTYLAFVHSTQTNTYQETGTWAVKNGVMIETIKSDTNPTTHATRSHVGQILHANTNEFVVQWQGSPDKWNWQKLSD